MTAVRVVVLAALLGGLATVAAAADGGLTALIDATHPRLEVVGLATFQGTCDVSAGVPLDTRRFAVADDEDNQLRVYDAERGGMPLQTIDIRPFLDLDREQGHELDLEAATGSGSAAYWLSSHSRLRSGERSPARLHFFATTLPQPGSELGLVGRPYRSLLEALAAAESLQDFGLDAAAQRGAQEEGGLNIEALTAGPDGRLWIGFRNPIPGGRALLVPLLNASELMSGRAPRFGVPVRLDLAGDGTRALSWWHGRFWIVAGAYDDRRRSRLYTWDGNEKQPGLVELARFGDFNAEGFFTPEGRDELMVLSDDGGVPIDGMACKQLQAPERKRFRGLWLRYSPQ